MNDKQQWSPPPSEKHDWEPRDFLIFGVVLAAVAGLMIGLAWPGTETNTLCAFDCNSETQHTGSKGVVIVGFVVAAIAQVALSIGVVSWGVFVGLRTARSRGLR